MMDFSSSDLMHAINEHIIGRNAERNRAILKRRLIDGIPFEPLAEEFNISTRQCKRIVYTCFERILKYL